MQATHRLDAVFAALADPTRRAIIARLASGQASVNQLARLSHEPARDLQAPQSAGARRPDFTRPRGPQRRRGASRPNGSRKPISGWNGIASLWEGNYKRLDALLDTLKTQAKERQSQ